MHALVRDGRIVDTRTLRDTWFDGTRYWDMRDETQRTAAGWLPVVAATRPGDTATATWERGPVDLVASVPTSSWVARPWTEDEMAARAKPATRRVSITPEQFGAVGDGVTDDTVPIQKSLDAAGKVRGTVIFTAPGYAVSPAQIITDDFAGAARHCLIARSGTALDLGRSTLAQLPTAEVTANRDIATSLIRLHRVRDVSIIGGTLVGDRVSRGVPDANTDGSNSGLIEVYCCEDIAITGVTMRDSTGDGVSIGDLSRWLTKVTATAGSPTITAPVASKNTYTLSVLETGGALEVAPSPMFPAGTRVVSVNPAARSVTMSQPALTSSAGTDGVVFWRANRQEITLTDCIADNNRRNGVTIESGRGITIRDCTLVNTNGASPEAGIDVEPYSGYDFLQDVTIEGCHTSGNRMAGMYVQNVRDVRVLGNDIRDRLTLRGAAACHVRGNDIRWGVTVKRSGVVFSGNRVIDGGVAIFNEPGTAHRMPLDVEITGNTFTSDRADTVRVTVFNTGGAAAVFRNLTIRSNTFRVEAPSLNAPMFTGPVVPAFEVVEVCDNLIHVEAGAWTINGGLVFSTFPAAPLGFISDNRIVVAVAGALYPGALFATLTGGDVTVSGNTVRCSTVTTLASLISQTGATIHAVSNVTKGTTALAAPGTLATDEGNVIL